jgi:hypothetical protein
MIARIGFRSGVIAFTATVAYLIVQLLQMLGALSFPIDEILIFSISLCIVVPFVLSVLAFHYSINLTSRFWTHAALIFTTMYAVFATANYVVQLTTVIPAKMRGDADSIRVLEQTPHSFMWDFDAIAYIAMAVAMLFIVPALGGTNVEKRLRIASLANAAATVLAGPGYVAELTKLARK